MLRKTLFLMFLRRTRTGVFCGERNFGSKFRNCFSKLRKGIFQKNNFT
ncbi:hypothetical protein LEP1GSC133_1147 [Leptospira borgpetersenii serovar Pomona str. 200901868]|uniref:Uncharacterized protein n=1 Tax=Leptospira borgpetersenii serovar Pomona str. 200901868 TaxID=1192866 RepID=M6VZR7_LEPBO|nr:hypothetical protein LEP1GSC133_1147 [Leptospira borgpetersenii serovar Pomona str. 200901868]